MEQLLKEIRESCSAEPFSPKWLVVPTSTLANHLREQLGRRARQAPLLSVRVIPISSFIRRIAGTRPPRDGTRWDPALDLALFELVQGLEPSSPLRRLRTLSGGFQLLRPTFLDLADGGFGPEQLEILGELSQDPELNPLERATLRLYAAWIRRIETLEVSWEPLIHQRLPEKLLAEEEPVLLTSLACESNQKPTVLLYGFYDFTDVNAQIVAALAERVDLRIFYPYRAEGKECHPAFVFAKSRLEDLRLRMGTKLEETLRLSAPRTEPAAAFFLSTFPHGDAGGEPDFLSFQPASGVQAEVLSAAVRIREWMDDEDHPVAPERIVLAAPDPAPYLDAVREIFPAFAIPFRLSGIPAGTTPESSALSMLGRIWENRGAAEWVLAYLRDHPNIAAMKGVDIETFEEKIRRLGVWGDSSWAALLESQAAHLSSDLFSLTGRERHLAGEIINRWLGEHPDGFTPGQAIEWFEALQDGWLEERRPLSALLQALQSMEKVSAGLRLPKTLLCGMMRRADECVQTEAMNSRGVLFLSVMRARGITSEAMVLLGLSSGSWPARIEEDPLLSDVSRGRLSVRAQDVGHRLPIKTQATEEMTLLFLLLNSSTKRMHWVVPETDEAGRTVAPTPWIQRYLQHWSRQSGHRSPPRIPRGPAQQAELLRTADPEGGSRLPPDFLRLIEPGETPGFPPESPRPGVHRGRELSWNGHVPEAALPSADPAIERVRVTDLENLAKCPYRFYAGSLAEWKPLEPMELTDQLSALNWGSLVHNFLERLISPWTTRGRTLQAVAKILLDQEGMELRKAAEEFAPDLHQLLHLLPLPFREAAQARLLDLVGSYLETALTEAHGRAVPSKLELKLRVPFPAISGLAVSGQVDRIDQRESGTHICDYKSGRSPYPAQLEREVRLGYRIQPTLYPWMYGRETASSQAITFSFIFLGESPPNDKEVPGAREVEDFLEPLGEILKAGMYLPMPTQTLELHGIEAPSCRYCDYASLCRKWDAGAYQHFFKLSKEQIPLRIRAMLDAGAKP